MGTAILGLFCFVLFVCWLLFLGICGVFLSFLLFLGLFFV